MNRTSIKKQAKQALPAFYEIAGTPNGHGQILAQFPNGRTEVVNQLNGYETDAFAWGYRGASPKASAAAIANHLANLMSLDLTWQQIDQLYNEVANWPRESRRPAITSLEVYQILQSHPSQRSHD